MAPTRVYLSLARGDTAAQSAAIQAHQEVVDWLKKNASNYGLPDTIPELDDVQKETVQTMYEGENGTDSTKRDCATKGLLFIATCQSLYFKVEMLPDLTEAEAKASVIGGAMTDPKPPHTKHGYGTLSMASGSAKNSSTSQFFICLAQAGSSEATKKLDGKYFVFGQLVEGEEVLRKLEIELEEYRRVRAVKTGESTGIPIWIEDCGLTL
ncbi:hypothetical protein QFC22_001312 [Naganishia vaughanmartiniae]|uniref:Uncharacterized protein n=1 Tax=Naganishia vaughanmartiniae TaxID=1424756 RepID=A0ACC2XIC1_9TREE|nr:hypothetical protein QFC22_001312 [Naganishia vaughanmartiniae]